MKDLNIKKHQQMDMFIADILDAKIKDDIHSMEHQIFSLSKKTTTKIVKYEHNGKTIEIVPSVKGQANIWDKDILMYCGSQLMAAINKKRIPKRKIRINAYDFFISTNRGTGGNDYILFLKSLERLLGTNIKTNIKTNNHEITEYFGLIDKLKIVRETKSKKGDKGATVVDITLSEWQYNAILGSEMLTLNDDYFRLKKGLHRALYLHARKHCGSQGKYQIGLEKIHKKIRSDSPFRKFKFYIKEIVKDPGYILDYKVDYNETNNIITFYNKSLTGVLAESKDSLKKIDKSLVKHVATDNIITAKDIEQAERVYKGVMKQSGDKAVASLIRDKMLRKE